MVVSTNYLNGIKKKPVKFEMSLTNFFEYRYDQTFSTTKEFGEISARKPKFTVKQVKHRKMLCASKSESVVSD